MLRDLFVAYFSGGWAPPAQQPPGMDPQLVQWFQSVDTDRSGRISCVELQQALTNANWSTFSPECCRLMIGKCFLPVSLWGYVCISPVISVSL